MKFLVFFFFVSLQIFGQQSKRDTINYRLYNKLEWSDFKAKTPADTHFSASVSTGMSYNWSYSTAGGIPDFKYKIEAKLYRNFSWAIYDTGKEHVLKHEQLHFDITELYVRKFRKALHEYEIGRTIRKDVNNIYQTLEYERKEIQMLYDKETNHSLNKEEQLIWEEKVNELLIKLEDFK